MQKAPLLFRPYLKRAIWGGEGIAEYKGESLPYSDIGESWELSAMEGRESTVASGPYKGFSLSLLTSQFAKELLGNRGMEKYGGEFPLLVKFIDARENLSVQVHPDEQLAMARHKCHGKTELWYVISASDGSRIYSGLKKTITPGEYVKHVEEGSFFDLVASYRSNPGDIYYLPSGQVHAIGSGNLLAEIQQPSDITYRIFDYKRKDANGKERTLHTEMALDAIDYCGGRDFRLMPEKISDNESLILKGKYFTVRRLIVSSGPDAGNKKNDPISLSLPEDSFLVIMCIKGKIKVTCEEGDATISEGHTALIPAECNSAEVSGEGILLLVTP